MNVFLLSSLSSYHHLATKMVEQGDKVYHFGANKQNKLTHNYIPFDVEISDSRVKDPSLMGFLFNKIMNHRPHFVMGSGISITKNSDLQKALTQRNIPFFFVSPECSEYESDKFVAKNMLKILGIPTPNATLMSAAKLKELYKDLTTPFVVKLNRVYQYGRQTVIVMEENRDEVYKSLFEDGLYRISEDVSLLVEEYVELKREYSYHALFNSANWRYFGSARDYKKTEDGDNGYNSDSFGAYSISDIDDVVHEYADKIYNYFKINGIKYRGFIFLGIGVAVDGTPTVLEINTRSGDPELNVMIDRIDNNLSELFFKASSDQPIPEILFNNKTSVAVRLMNTNPDWNIQATSLPKIKNLPPSITHSYERDEKYLRHSVFTAETSEEIYEFLQTQDLGQYRYRTDIGILK